MRRRPLPLVLIVVMSGASLGCVANKTVAEFAAAGTQASALLPRVAGISFSACVEQHVYEQLENEQEPDRATAHQACASNARARDRLIAEYSVIATYLNLLGRIASGSPAAYDTSVARLMDDANSLAAIDNKEQSALKGLAGAVADAYLHARKHGALKRAIAAADPHVQVLCSAFQNNIKDFILATLSNEEGALRDLYEDSATTQTERLLLYRQFESDLNAITNNRALAMEYSTLLGQIASGHARLAAMRDELRSRDTLQIVFQNIAAIQRQLNNVRALM